MLWYQHCSSGTSGLVSWLMPVAQKKMSPLHTKYKNGLKGNSRRDGSSLDSSGWGFQEKSYMALCMSCIYSFFVCVARIQWIPPLRVYVVVTTLCEWWCGFVEWILVGYPNFRFTTFVLVMEASRRRKELAKWWSSDSPSNCWARQDKRADPIYPFPHWRSVNSTNAHALPYVG